MFKKIKKIFSPLNLGILIIALITFAPIFKIGFATNDDFVIYFMSNYNWLKSAYESAVFQGRFFFIFSAMFFYIPYLFDFELWKRFFQFIPILLIIIGFYKIISVYFGKKKLGLIFILFYFVFFQLTSYYNAFISYHFYFTTGFASIVWAFYFLQKYFKNQKHKNLIISQVLFAFGIIFYELYIVYILFFIILIFNNIYSNQKKSIFSDIKATLFKSRGFIIICLIYVISFFAFRFFHPSNYDGNQFADNFYLSVYFNTVLKLINGALPLNNFFPYFDFFNAKSIDINGFSMRDFMFSKLLSVSNWIKILLILIILLKTLKSVKYINNAKVFFSMIIGLFLLFIPALTIALGRKYMRFQAEHYTITVFQIFGTVLILMGIFILIDNYLRKYKILQYFSRFIIFIFIAFCSIAHDYANNMFAFDLQQSQEKFKLIDNFMGGTYYKSIESEAVVYAPTLWNNTAYEAKDVTNFGFGWAEYSKIKHHIKRNIVLLSDDFWDLYKKDTLKAKIPVYSFILKQTYKTSDLLLIASKVDSNIIINGNALCDTVELFISSVNKSVLISYKTINSLSDSLQKPEYHAVNTKNKHKNTFWNYQLIDKNIDLQSVNISFVE